MYTCEDADLRRSPKVVWTRRGPCLLPEMTSPSSAEITAQEIVCSWPVKIARGVGTWKYKTILDLIWRRRKTHQNILCMYDLLWIPRPPQLLPLFLHSNAKGEPIDKLVSIKTRNLWNVFALNHEKILYRAIFRARYNVAVTCVVALAPEQDVSDFCCWWRFYYSQNF